MRLDEYVNKVSKRECPQCGKRRPHDWFVPLSAVCWKCRQSNGKAARK